MAKVRLMESEILKTVSCVQRKQVPVKAVGEVELSLACDNITNGEAEIKNPRNKQT